ncbi:MAG: glycosyltransferase family 39 protein [Planctomycetes bacterium]|nr:glycosyltransferase family 39 protein [Planctomycetota bacterium]
MPARHATEPTALGFADPGLLVVLAVTLVLQCSAWAALDGYQIADSVEFLERARSLVRGEAMVDSVSIRPVGFSALLVPLFVVGDWIGLPDQRALAWCSYLLQIVLGLLLVHRVARIGAALGGRNTGLVAGLFVGANPLFLQYSAQAESGIAAALCLALGLERFLARGTRRDHLLGGLWLGVGFLVAYKALVVILVIALVLFVRDRWKHGSSWLSIAAALALAMLVQTGIDWAIYGKPGASLVTYLVTNFGSVTYSILYRAGLVKLAHPIYEFVQQFQGKEFDAPDDPVAIGYRGKQSRWWYFEQMPQMLVWPVLAGFLLGLARAAFRAQWKSTLLVAAFLVFAAATSNKGSKDFRLWIPILPCLAPLSAWGLEGVLASVKSKAWRRTWRALFAVPAVALGLAAFLALPTRRFGAYWDAMDAANARAHELYAERVLRARAWGGTRAPESVQVASAYNWAVYLHDEPGVDLVKLPHQLTGWLEFDGAHKAHDLEALAELDLFVAHQPILSLHPDLLEWVAAHYDVRSYAWDRGRQQETGPIYLLERRSDAFDAARFFEVRPGASPDAFRDQRALDAPFSFVATDGSGEKLVLLGFEIRALPTDGWSWITYHWWTPTGVSRDLTIVDRLTALDERSTWQNDHRGAWGARPTSQWRAGDLVSEGYPLVPAMRAFATDGPFRPIGGGYRRGERIPVRLWMQLVELDKAALERGERVVVASFAPARNGSFEPIAAPTDPMRLETPEGLAFSADGLVRVGATFLDVHPSARVPNDGRPVPE